MVGSTSAGLFYEPWWTHSARARLGRCWSAKNTIKKNAPAEDNPARVGTPAPTRGGRGGGAAGGGLIGWQLWPLGRRVHDPPERALVTRPKKRPAGGARGLPPTNGSQLCGWGVDGARRPRERFKGAKAARAHVYVGRSGGGPMLLSLSHSQGLFARLETRTEGGRDCRIGWWRWAAINESRACPQTESKVDSVCRHRGGERSLSPGVHGSNVGPKRRLLGGGWNGVLTLPFIRRRRRGRRRGRLRGCRQTRERLSPRTLPPGPSLSPRPSVGGPARSGACDSTLFPLCGGVGVARTPGHPRVRPRPSDGA